MYWKLWNSANFTYLTAGPRIMGIFFRWKKFQRCDALLKHRLPPPKLGLYGRAFPAKRWHHHYFAEELRVRLVEFWEQPFTSSNVLSQAIESIESSVMLISLRESRNMSISCLGCTPSQYSELEFCITSTMNSWMPMHRPLRNEFRRSHGNRHMRRHRRISPAETLTGK